MGDLAEPFLSAPIASSDDGTAAVRPMSQTERSPLVGSYHAWLNGTLTVERVTAVTRRERGRFHASHSEVKICLRFVTSSGFVRCWMVRKAKRHIVRLARGLSTVAMPRFVAQHGFMGALSE